MAKTMHQQEKMIEVSMGSLQKTDGMNCLKCYPWDCGKQEENTKE